MSEQIVKPDESGTAPEQPSVVLTQADVDRAAAGARKEAEAKLKESNERLIALEAKEKERADAELTEVERLKNSLTEKEEQITGLTSENTGYKEAEEKRKTALAEKVEEEMKDLTDEQKASVELMPLDGQLGLIAQFKKEKPQSGEWGKGTSGVNGSLEAVKLADEQFGKNSPQFRKAWEDYQNTKRR